MIKTVRTIFIFSTIFMLGLGIIDGRDHDSTVRESPPNPWFIVYLNDLLEIDKHTQVGRKKSDFFGEVPSPLDRSHLKNVAPPFLIEWYATSYDLRPLNKLTDIRNQGSCGACWTFATMASIESFGKPGNDWNFSEQDLNLNHGFDLSECNGGNQDMATAYLARWGGPVSESDVPYPYGSPARHFPKQYSPQKHIQKVIYIPQRISWTDNDTIKYFISTYGAVYVSFYYSSSYIDASDLNYYNNVNVNTNHAVNAVGWDDNYPASNFRSDRQPPGNGAFLIRNSWGTARHDNGYLWISYYDTSFIPRLSICNTDPEDNYDTIYQYDPLGQVSSSGYGSAIGWAANIFSAEGDSYLKAVSFYTNDTNSSYDIYIYKGVSAGSPRSGQLVATKSGSRTYPGYYTETLNSAVLLNQDDLFSVVVKFTNSSYTYPIPIEKMINGYSSAVVSNPGESFISSSGSTWTDANSYGWNVCIKAFTNNAVSVSGTVTSGGPGLVNVEMRGLPGIPLTNGSGYYIDYVENGWSGTVIPTLEGYSFANPSTSYSNLTTDIITNYTATGISLTVTSPNGGESLTVGTTHDIGWDSTGNLTNVAIEYSIDGGSTWISIVKSTENDGSFPWTIPDISSNDCLVRVLGSFKDSGPSDTSDAVFTIVPSVSGSLVLRSPNGGESWEMGTTQQIKWSFSGDIGTVNISYSIDGGKSWISVVEGTSNDGRHDWHIPNTPSASCLVKISANQADTDPVLADISDARFEITVGSGPAFFLESPNGGEQWLAGSEYSIAWQSYHLRDEVKLEYSVNGGENWQLIVEGLSNDGSYRWVVPSTVSDNCLLRVSDINGQTSDSSDSVFSILLPESSGITVTSPNGGEEWAVASPQQIKWTTDGGIESVRIEYTHDNGKSWISIIDSTPNDGLFDWTVPDSVSENCRVRITDNAGAADPSPSDISDQLFMIVPSVSESIQLRSPNGGEQLPVGARFRISWKSYHSRTDVKLSYSINGGGNWTSIVDQISDTGSYDWIIPDEISSNCLVRISDIDGNLIDVSDAVFSITQAQVDDVTLSSPNGGENWGVGTTREISWTAGGDINNVRIDYSNDNGKSWHSIVQSTPNDGKYDWVVPDMVSDLCLVQVRANDGDTDPLPSDISDNVFSIVSTDGEFRVISPNGGESWEVYSTQSISWTHTGSFAEVQIDYSDDNGKTWSSIIHRTPNDGQFDWIVPDMVSDNCLVRIRAADSDIDPLPTDTSDLTFSIVPPSSATIVVLVPNGGEELAVGSTSKVSWKTYHSREDVQLSYSTNGGDSWTVIADQISDSGTYEWTVPDTPSVNCLLRVADINGQLMDISDAVFSIVSSQSISITLTVPNGGEDWAVGSDQEITWTADESIDQVSIEYSIDAGKSWRPVVQSTANDGSYSWTVPDAVSESCLVRVLGISSDTDENPVDVSDQFFSISSSSSKTLALVLPNGGEILRVGESYDITWRSTGLNSVIIEYSVDNGDQWTAIVTTDAVDGSFIWTVPNTPSANCLVRIKGDDSPGDPSDTSDAVFTISDN